MTRREFLREQKYGTPQLPTRLPARQFEQKKMAAEKYVRITPKPAPPQPETLREVFSPAYSSLTTLELEMGFTAGDLVAHSHKFRVLYYHGYPIEYSLGGRHARTIKALLEVA